MVVDILRVAVAINFRVKSLSLRPRNRLRLAASSILSVCSDVVFNVLRRSEAVIP
jgi:hypothetical protein